MNCPHCQKPTSGDGVHTCSPQITRSSISESELLALQLSDLSRDTPFAISHISTGMFSVARHYGSMTFQCRDYTYFPEHDECIRVDVVGWLKKYRKQQAALEKLSAENERLSLGRYPGEVRTHQPKGGMCSTCLRGLTRNCAGLPFESMPVLDVDKSTGVKIVRCLDHMRQGCPNTGELFDASPEKGGA